MANGFPRIQPRWGHPIRHHLTYARKPRCQKVSYHHQRRRKMRFLVRTSAMLGSGYGRTDFSQIFFRGFLLLSRRIFSRILPPDFPSHFVGKKPRKILQENPRQNPPKFVQLLNVFVDFLAPKEGRAHGREGKGGGSEGLVKFLNYECNNFGAQGWLRVLFPTFWLSINSCVFDRVN